MKLISFFAILFSPLFFFSSCTKNSSSPSLTTTVGEYKAYGSDSIRSWVVTDANGKPTSLGITFKATLLADLPANDTMMMLMFPEQMGMSSMMAMPFDHVEIDWAPHGDPSPSVYNVAHLDCHFFTIAENSMMNIMAGPDSVALGSQYIPKDCRADGDAEASMGVHWVDSTAPEYHGMGFTHAYNYGFYHGGMTFIESTCAMSFLSTKANYTGAIKQPGAFASTGYYPTKYTISYNAATNEYTYSLDGLTSH